MYWLDDFIKFLSDFVGRKWAEYIVILLFVLMVLWAFHKAGYL